MRTECAAACLLLVASLGTVSCGRAVPAAVSPTDDACVVVDDSARARITLGIGERVDTPVASLPLVVRAQLYETLLRVDCTGEVVSGLADEWSTDDGRTWNFRIATGSAFADGTLATAASVIAAWSNARVERLATVTALGQQHLRVTLDAPSDPRIFAMPLLAVIPPATDGWPAGTGSYAPHSLMPDGTLKLLARTPDARTPDTIDVHGFSGDPRIALDSDIDVIVTADASTLAYARARSDYTITPLPWSRTYVLAAALATDPGSGPDIETLRALARDAVRGDARPALPPFWWDACSAPTRTTPAAGSAVDIIFAGDDAVARALAERITALAWPRDRAPDWLRAALPSYTSAPSARAVGETDLRSASALQSTLAVVGSLPRSPYAACGTIPAGAGAATHVWLTGWHLTPLLDARDYMIHHSGIGRVRVDGLGTIRFGG